MILFTKNKSQILQPKLWALMQRLELFKNLGILLFFHGYKIFDDTEHFDIMISLQNFQFVENVRGAVTLAIHQSSKLVLKIFSKSQLDQTLIKHGNCCYHVSKYYCSVHRAKLQCLFYLSDLSKVNFEQLFWGFLCLDQDLGPGWYRFCL